jgi:cytochrome c-type biogenesis protein CcmH/NrfG
MAKGDYSDALDYFHRALTLAPQYSVLLINLAIAEDATKQSAAAEQHFHEALRLAPSSPDSYTYYARDLLAQADGQSVNQPAKQSPGVVVCVKFCKSDQGSDWLF